MLDLILQWLLLTWGIELMVLIGMWFNYTYHSHLRRPSAINTMLSGLR